MRSIPKANYSMYQAQLASSIDMQPDEANRTLLDNNKQNHKTNHNSSSPNNHKPIIAHVDMDCFFCSCEQIRKPYLKDKAFVVAAASKRAVVSSANYIARKYGITSAMPLFKVKRKYAQTLVVSQDIEYYIDMSKKVMQILHSLTDLCQQVSIDEAYLDLTHLKDKFKTQKHLARWIQSLILQKTKLQASVGIASSKTIAKIASDHNKPFGITIVENDYEFLKNQSITKLPGIGKRTKYTFIKNNITTIGDLAHLNTSTVMDAFGEQGIYLQNIALGKHKSKVKKHVPRKSMSRETTLLKNITNTNILLEHLFKLIERIDKRLDSTYYKTITLKIKYADFKIITRNYSFPTMGNSKVMFKQIIAQLFHKHYNGKPVRLVGVKVTPLISVEKQKTMEEYC